MIKKSSSDVIIFANAPKFFSSGINMRSLYVLQLIAMDIKSSKQILVGFFKKTPYIYL